MLSITALTDAEYLISSVALSVDEYYLGVGESPGVWSGKWAPGLGLAGVVEADQLRALVEGRHSGSGVDLLAGHRSRTTAAFDMTFSAPKSVSLLWALGSETVAEIVAEVHSEAVATALRFLEERAAVARIQRAGVRRQVATEGFVVAGFVHRTSREGDPQLHTHCLIPNLVQRTLDGKFVSIDAGPLYDWCRAAGSVYQNEVQRLLMLRLGVSWGPDRNNTREIIGFTRKQLRSFSKRSAQIEAELERQGAMYESPVLRMQADDQASLATRRAKDHSLTPALLVGRWRQEAADAGLAVGVELDRTVCFAEPDLELPSWDELTARLVDEERGLCARSPRFTHADVVEHVCALSGGRLTMEEVTESADRFLSSELAVRLTPEAEGARRQAAEWSTAAHRKLEDDTLMLLDRLSVRTARPVRQRSVEAALTADRRLGVDQVDGVRVLCGEGGSVRAVLAPAGYGKTAMAHAAAAAAGGEGRPVLAVATTAKAVAEVAEAGLAACTIAQLRIELTDRGLAPGTVLLLDEISQTPTRDAHTVLEAVDGCAGGMLWVMGDPRQSQSVAAGGMADEIQRRAEQGQLPLARLEVNRRQVDPADRDALELLRRGRAAESQELRADQGWEHEHATPQETREAMADAVFVAVSVHGAAQVAALAVSHADVEDVADRIRARLTAGGVLTGPSLAGPGWTDDRHYRAGDRVLLHAQYGGRGSELINGTVATVTRADKQGLTVRLDNGTSAVLPAGFVQGTRRDDSPNLSHGWCRTVDGAQGGTWDVCHLLGSSALNAFRGYSGQSRSRLPTHSWNTTRVLTVDHGGVLADQRSGMEQVAAALVRQPDPSLAARSDPYVVERQLLDQIRAHQTVLANRPPSRLAEIAQAERQLSTLRNRQAFNESMAASTQQRLDRLGGLSVLRPKARAERQRLQDEVRRRDEEVREALEASAAGEATLARLRAEQVACDAFEPSNGWRRDAIGELRDKLNHHWADVVLACVHADDPLAYGIDKLRHTRQTIATELAKLQASIPADREAERDQARHELISAVQSCRSAESDYNNAKDRPNRTGMQNDPRRPAITVELEVRVAQERLHKAVEAEKTMREKFMTLDEHERLRRQALSLTADRRGERMAALASIEDAFDHTRHERVAALAENPPRHLVELIGRVPADQNRRAVWERAAEMIEEQLDRHGPESAVWKEFCRDLRRTRAQVASERKQAVHRIESSRPTMWTDPYQIENSRGPERGL